VIAGLLLWGATALAGDGDDALVEAMGQVTGADRTEVAPDALAAARGLLTERFGNAPLAESLPAACDADEVVACVGAGWQLGFVDGRPSAEATDPERAAHALEKACAKGFLRACVARARMVQRGIGAPADPTAAADQWRAACDRGEPRGCLWLGKAHQLGLGVPRDGQAARERAEAACTDAHPAGCNALALALHLGTGGDKDLGRALTLYQQACDAGFAPACDNLGPLYQGGLPGVDGRRELLQDACSAEPAQPSACAHLGEILAGSAPADAMAAFRTACDAKLARGCQGVALLILDGAAAGDEAEALTLLEGACEVGEPAACARLGDELWAGDRLERDRARAYEVRAVACRGGHGPACVEAATQLKRGRGPERDKAGAAELMERACVLGVDEACP